MISLLQAKMTDTVRRLGSPLLQQGRNGTGGGGGEDKKGNISWHGGIRGLPGQRKGARWRRTGGELGKKEREGGTHGGSFYTTEVTLEGVGSMGNWEHGRGAVGGPQGIGDGDYLSHR